jgi:hypothetical protein
MDWTVWGSNPGEGARFPHLSRPSLRPTQPASYIRVPGLFPGDKEAGAWRLPPIPSSAKVKERVELHFYSPSGPLWPVGGWTLPYNMLCVDLQ